MAVQEGRGHVGLVNVYAYTVAPSGSVRRSRKRATVAPPPSALLPPPSFFYLPVGILLLGRLLNTLGEVILDAMESVAHRCRASVACCRNTHHEATRTKARRQAAMALLVYFTVLLAYGPWSAMSEHGACHRHRHRHCHTALPRGREASKCSSTQGPVRRARSALVLTRAQIIALHSRSRVFVNSNSP